MALALRRDVWRLMLAAVLVAGGTAWAQLLPENVLVVINRWSQDSIAVGERYVERRGIPRENVVRVLYNHPSQQTTWPVFREQVFEPVMAHLYAQGIRRRIHLILLTKGIPYDVESEAATWMFYAHGVRLQQRNPYFNTGRPLNAWRDLGPGRYASVMLTAFTRDEALALIERGAAADRTHPQGTVYFMRGTPYRDVRRGQVPPVAAELGLMGVGNALLNGHHLEGRPDVLGYMTGATWVKTSNTYLPGAFAEHMTSFAGRIYEEKGGQMSVLHFIRAGATGTCGTVDEPTNMWTKFPRAEFYLHYARGFTLGEAMWQSVALPYQVIFVGDPLACPFARERPWVKVEKLGGAAQGKIKFRVSADGGAGHRVAGVLVSVDGQPALPLPGTLKGDTRVTLVFGRREGKERKTVRVGAVVASDRGPGEALAKIAKQLAGLEGFAVSAKVNGDALELTYQPGADVPGVFECVTERVGGGLGAWVSPVRICRFQGQATPLPAGMSFTVRGRAQGDATVGLEIGRVTRTVGFRKGQAADEMLQAVCAAFANDAKICGAQGLRFVIAKGAKDSARLTIVSKQPGAAWNGTDVTLRLGRSVGFMVMPYERRAKLLGGTLTQPGSYRLELVPNMAAAEREIHLTIGEQKISSGAQVSAAQAVFALLRALREAAPEVNAVVERGRLVLRYKEEFAPRLSVECEGDDFTGELLGARWVKMRNFEQVQGKVTQPVGYKWMAILQFYRGKQAFDWAGALDVSYLRPGAHKVEVRAVCIGSWMETATTECGLQIAD